MKKCVAIGLALIVFAGVALAQPAEQFRVITVNGSVENTKTKKQLQPGDRIASSDALKFGSREAYVIVISPKVGRKKISGVPDNNPRELENLVKSFLKPDEKSTGTRGSIEYWDALNQSLKDTVLILGDGIVPLDKEYINLDKPAVVVAFFKGKNNQHITRVVSRGQNLCLSARCLFENELPERFGYLLVEYYENEKDSRDLPGSGKYIGYFVPNFANPANLEREARIISETLTDHSRDHVIKEIKKYLSEEYGHVQDDNLLQWLKDIKLINP
jgi:hypothetical protein